VTAGYSRAGYPGKRSGRKDLTAKHAHYPNLLRASIRQAGYTFREVSRETTIPESTLYDWASGKRPIPHYARGKLACLLGCDEQQLQPLATGTSMLTRKSMAGALLIYLALTSGVRSLQRLTTYEGPDRPWPLHHKELERWLDSKQP